MKTNSVPFPSPQQQGVQKGLSCIIAAFNLQETVFTQIENGSNAYTACLDQKAALDSVWHMGFLQTWTIGNTWTTFTFNNAFVLNA